MSERGLEAYAEIRFLNPQECRFELSAGGLLSLRLNDELFDSIGIHRAFPFTYGNDYLSVRDQEENEIGMIHKLSEFSKEQRALILGELERRYFIPSVKRITRIKEEFGYAYWDVETDRGAHRFTVRGLHESVLRLGPKRIIITDVDGNRFEIPDVSLLDAKSQRLIDILF